MASLPMGMDPSEGATSRNRSIFPGIPEGYSSFDSELPGVHLVDVYGNITGIPEVFKDGYQAGM